MQQKFRRLSAPMLSPAQQDIVIETIGRLDSLASVGELTRHLRGEGSH
jgi:hypothetical protein